MEGASFVTDHGENALFFLVLFKYIRISSVTVRVVNQGTQRRAMVADGEVLQYFVVVVFVDVVFTAYSNVDDLNLIILHADKVGL